MPWSAGILPRTLVIHAVQARCTSTFARRMTDVRHSATDTKQAPRGHGEVVGKEFDLMDGLAVQTATIR